MQKIIGTGQLVNDLIKSSTIFKACEISASNIARHLLDRVNATFM